MLGQINDEVQDTMLLTVELALELAVGTTDGNEGGDAAHVDVGSQLGVDLTLAAVDLASEPSKLFARADDIVAVNQRAEVVHASAAVDTDTVFELVVVAFQLTLGVAELGARLGNAVAGEFANGVDLLVGRVEGRICILANVLVPGIGAEIAVEVVGEGTIAKPLRGEVGQRVGILLHVLLVEVEGVDKVAVADTAAEALVAVTVIQFTRVPTTDDLAVAGEPTGEDTVLVTTTDISCVVAVLNGNLEGTTGVVTTDECRVVTVGGSDAFDVGFVTAVLNEQFAFAVAVAC